MTIEKLPSGSYRISQSYEGKRYRVTVDHKPTKMEAQRLITEKIESAEKIVPDKGSVESYIQKYIAYCKTSGKSPATIRTYDSLSRNIPESILKMDINKVTNSDLQEAINSYAETHVAKGTRNMFTLVSSTLAKYRPEFKIIVKLPTAEKKAEYEPTTDDIKAILKEVKGTNYDIALQLAVLGVRRGEIYALTIDDLDSNNVLTIDKDTVVDENQKLVTKAPKTQASVRRITLPGPLADQIRNQGYIYKGAIGQINKYLGAVQRRLGIPHFKLHKLRAYCVAYLHKSGFTDEQIMAWGGWSTTSIMHTAYRYNLDPSESQAEIVNKMNNILSLD